MDLLGDPPAFNLCGYALAHLRAQPGACRRTLWGDGRRTVTGSVVTEGCEVYGAVRTHAVLFAGAVVVKGAIVVDWRGHAGQRRLRQGAVRDAARSWAENCVIGENCVVGAAGGPIALVGYSTCIPAGVRVAAGEQTDEEKLSEEAAHQ